MKFDKKTNVSQLSDMIDVSTREFTRQFSRYRTKAAQGEAIRITSPDGRFLFTKEPKGIRAGDFLRQLEANPEIGFFEKGGAEKIDQALKEAQPARSPWD